MAEEMRPARRPKVSVKDPGGVEPRDAGGREELREDAAEEFHA
jgi:hypothetical protein